MKKVYALLFMLVTLVGLVGCNQSVNDKKIEVRGMLTEEQLLEMIVNVDEEVYQRFSKQLKDHITMDEYKQVVAEFVAGENFKVRNEVRLNDGAEYVWFDERDEKYIQAIMNEQGMITMILFSVHEGHEKDSYVSETIHRYPFVGEWFTFWGGQRIPYNYHYEYEHIRYAYDFVIVKDGQSYDGDPLNNESYYAFGEPVVATADGIVVEVVDGIEDNVPGQFNRDQVAGNYVVIEHKNGERSFIAHLKQYSIEVTEGQEITAGEVIGLCGNSGNSSEPHIHYHTFIYDGQKEKVELDDHISIPTRFENVEELNRGMFAVGENIIE